MPTVGHGADQIKVNLGTQEKTLQEAIDTLNTQSLILTYVGTCGPIGPGTCKCGLGEKIMLLESKSAGNSGWCGVNNQGKLNVEGTCDSQSYGGNRFACFK